MRSLMFFEEQKRKKISKIKSKTYHKIAKRAKSKLEGEEMDLETLKALDPEAAEERMRKMELERIKVKKKDEEEGCQFILKIYNPLGENEFKTQKHWKMGKVDVGQTRCGYRGTQISTIFNQLRIFI